MFQYYNTHEFIQTPLIIILPNFAILTNALLEFVDIKLQNLRTLGFREQLLGIN